MSKPPKKTLSASSIMEWSNALPPCPDVLPDGTRLAVEAEDDGWQEIDVPDHHEPKKAAGANIDPKQQPHQLPSPKAKDPGLPVGKPKGDSVSDPPIPSVVVSLKAINGAKGVKKDTGKKWVGKPEQVKVKDMSQYGKEEDREEEEQGMEEQGDGMGMRKRLGKGRGGPGRGMGPGKGKGTGDPATCPFRKLRLKKAATEEESDQEEDLAAIHAKLAAIKARKDAKKKKPVPPEEKKAEKAEQQEKEKGIDPGGPAAEYDRERQFPPEKCQKGTFRTITLGKGKKGVVCRVKGLGGKTRLQTKLIPKEGIDDEIDIEALLGEMAETVESEGYDIPEDMDAMEFTEAVEGIIESDQELDDETVEFLKLATEEVKEQLDENSALDEMAEALEAAGYEIPEEVDPDEFLENVESILESDNDLDETVKGLLRRGMKRAKRAYHRVAGELATTPEKRIAHLTKAGAKGWGKIDPTTGEASGLRLRRMKAKAAMKRGTGQLIPATASEDMEKPYAFINEETGELEVSEDIYNLLDGMVKLLETEGYEVEEGLSVDEFIDQLEAVLESDKEIEEATAEVLKTSRKTVADLIHAAGLAKDADRDDTEKLTSHAKVILGKQKPQTAPVKDTHQYSKETTVSKDTQEPLAKHDEPKPKI